jgi:hypothetical protein
VQLIYRLVSTISSTEIVLNSDIEISRKDAKARRMKEKKNMLLQKFSKHFTNSVNSPLQKFLKTTLRLCDFACLP